MRGTARYHPGTGRSAVVLFSQTFPFGQGEEFLEAEIPHLLRAFDSVVLVPTLHASGMPKTRDLPEGVVLITPENTQSRQAAVVARFCVRHPLSASRSLLRSLRAGPQPYRIWADFRFDLHSAAVGRAVARGVEHALRGIDRLIFYAFWLHTPARVALEVQRLLGLDHVPVVSRANGFDLYTERHPHNYLPQRDFLLSGLSTVFAASETAEDYLRVRYPEHGDIFTFARIGTPDAIAPGNPDRAAMHVVSCSYIAPVKRLEMLIDDLAHAQKHLTSQITWTHIGSGPADYTQEVTAYASRHLVTNSFTFAGHMANSELRRWYADNPASVFVHVSESEGGLAASIQEALAQGLPVIATAVGGVTVLTDSSQVFNGRLASDHSPAEFTERLQHLMAADEDAYSSYVSSSMAFWREHCSADVLASSFVLRLMEITNLGVERSEVGPSDPQDRGEASE